MKNENEALPGLAARPRRKSRAISVQAVTDNQFRHRAGAVQKWLLEGIKTAGQTNIGSRPFAIGRTFYPHDCCPMKTTTRKRLVSICTLGALAGIVAIPLNPVNCMVLRLAFLGCAAGAWLGFTILAWNRKPLRIALMILPLALSVPFFLPGREMDSAELRDDYVQRMESFESTKYYWGGESSRGIDCAGLPRRALRDALFSYGIRHADGGSFRSFAQQWWFDASAKALGEGYREYTRPRGIAGTIREMDDSKLAAGDLAVTDDGVHILAYAGEGRWIQADPGIGAVATLDGHTADNIWFRIPVTIHRWRILDENPRH